MSTRDQSSEVPRSPQQRVQQLFQPTASLLTAPPPGSHSSPNPSPLRRSPIQQNSPNPSPQRRPPSQLRPALNSDGEQQPQGMTAMGMLALFHCSRSPSNTPANSRSSSPISGSIAGACGRRPFHYDEDGQQVDRLQDKISRDSLGSGAGMTRKFDTWQRQFER